jgi:putative restriction endonuclease
VHFFEGKVLAKCVLLQFNAFMRRDWSREELIVAFNLYCKIPFGRIHIRNTAVVALAKEIGRTPSAVSWKLANFARLDPSLKKRNIAGAAHGSKAEVEIWTEFSNNWERLTFESEVLLRKLARRAAESIEDVQEFPEGKSREALVRTRVNQGFFRAAVLAAYNERCCITGLAIPQLLNASHIVPWVVDVKNRTNPRNGLCLNTFHDRAFDCGLLTITPELKVRLSPSLKSNPIDKVAREFLWRFHDTSITPPLRFAPDVDFLRYHNRVVFKES